MGNLYIYFISFVAICVAVVFLLVWRGEKKHSARVKARKKKLLKKANLRARHELVRHRSVHGHSASRSAGVWEARNKRASEEIRDGTSSFAAQRLYSDGEKSGEESSEAHAMGTVGYRPEEPPKKLRGRS